MAACRQCSLRTGLRTAYSIRRNSTLAGQADVVEISQKVHDAIGDLEERWDGSPYLKMLSSPLRRCAVTQKVIPRDLMLLLKPVRLPENQEQSEPSPNKSKSPSGNVQVLLPDQVIHPRFAQKKQGQGLWITLDRTVLTELEARNLSKILMPGTILPPRLEGLVHSQLVQRVQQEAELMTSRIISTPKGQIKQAFLHQSKGRDELETLLRSTDGSGRMSYVAGLVDGPADEFATTLRLEADEDESPSLPVYSPLAIMTDQEMQPLTKQLHRLIGHEQRTFDRPPSPPSNFLALLQSPYTTPLAIALWRLKLWSPHA